MNIPASISTLFEPATIDWLVSLRHDIHSHPDLSFQEHGTAERLEKALGTFCDDVRRVAGTGVVARIKGTGGADGSVALRGDIDALPIKEQTGLPFSSTVDGVMHACGHDVHATWAVAAAWLLNRNPAPQDVVVILQPAEETGHGADGMVEAGVLDGVTQIFGAHVDRRFPLGSVVADEGPLAASADIFSVTARGGGAHGARPHEAADPVAALAQFIVAAQTIVSRKLDPAKPAVVTFGQLEAGSAPNIIPTHATTRGTIRTMDSAVRDQIHRELKNVGESIATLSGADVAVDVEPGPGPVVNPHGPTSVARRAVTEVLGEEALVPFGIVNMAAEDFSAYQERVPGCFLRIGARHTEGEVIPAHSPKFYAEDESIFVGAAVLAECARQAVSNDSGGR